MTILTLSKLKRVCTIILVPRMFRGDGCTPGKFHRLTYEALRKVHKSSSSGRSDNTRCRRCKRIIDRAFGPPQYYYIDKPRTSEINNETIKLRDKNSITRLEDLKSKVSAEAKANVLLRAREINMILASIDKRDKHSHAKTVKGLAEAINATKIENDNLKCGTKVEKQEASKLLHEETISNKEELKSHGTTTETKEGVVVLSSTTGKESEIAAKNEETGIVPNEEIFFRKDKDQFETKCEEPGVLLKTTVGKDKEEIEIKSEKVAVTLSATDEKDKELLKIKNEQADVVLSATDGKDREQLEAKCEMASFVFNETAGKANEEFKPHSLVTETKKNVPDGVSSRRVKDDLKLYDIRYKKNEAEQLTQTFEEIDENLPEPAEKGAKAGIVLNTTAEKDKEEFESKGEKSGSVVSASVRQDKEELKKESEKASDILVASTETEKGEVETKGEKSGAILNVTTGNNEEFEAMGGKVSVVNETAKNIKEEFETKDEKSEGVFSASAKSENEEFEAHPLVSKTKENLINNISSEKEIDGLKLNATTSKKAEEQKLIQKLEEIDEVPLVEPEPKRDIRNNSKQESGPSFLNATSFDKRTTIQAQIFDEIAKKYLGSKTAHIDGQLSKEMEQMNLRFDSKSTPGDDVYFRFDKQNNVEEDAKEKATVNTVKSPQPGASPQLAASNSFLQQNEIGGSKDHELEPKVVSISPVGPKDTFRSISCSEGNPSEKHENNWERLAPDYGWRVAERGDIRCSGTKGEVTLNPVDDGVHIHLEQQKQPVNLFQRQLLEAVNPTAPKSSIIIRDDPDKMPKPVELDSLQFINMDRPVERTMNRGEAEFPFDGNKMTHYYTEYKKHWCTEAQELQLPSTPILPDRQAHTNGRRGIIRPENVEETKMPAPSAAEVAQSFIQAQSLPLPEEQQTLAEMGPIHPAQTSVDHPLPEIDLNDETLSLKELLHRVRERNRIMYCREIGFQVAKNMATLNPQGKCGGKKPKCPPPAPTCPPPDPCPPPPCPPPPPPCPKPCKPKCPAPCPPPAPKCPCKCSAQNAVTIALHLGPVVNPAKKVLLPLLVCNLSPALNSDEDVSCPETWTDVIKQKLEAIIEALQSAFEWLTKDMMKQETAMSVIGPRDYTPWTPIPSWPYPVVQKKKGLQCPKEGCPTPPPSRPACPERPCTGFPKRLTFSDL